MSKSVIFGSGIVGLIAKKILVGDWDIVPFGKSRYYTYNPPLADNFITRDKEIDEVIKDIAGINNIFLYRRCYSIQGRLVSEYNEALTTVWLEKVFGDNIPGQALLYMSKQMMMPIYDIRINKLYKSLQDEYLQELKTEAVKGQVTDIGKHYYVRGGIRTEFDKAISTIPLSKLFKLINHSTILQSKDEHFILLKSSHINLEGHNQALVVDLLIDFYKVSMLAPELYMFYFTKEIERPGAYLLHIIGEADIIDGTKILESLPIGQTPNLDWLDDYGIFCIGSCAQHDPFACVGSNLLRLVRYAQRGYKLK